VSFSGGKDSTVMLHLVMDEAIKRGRRVGVFIIDMELSTRRLSTTSNGALTCTAITSTCTGVHSTEPAQRRHQLRAAVDVLGRVETRRVGPRKAHGCHSGVRVVVPGMEFEEFMVIWASVWAGQPTVGFIGIRADESLHGSGHSPLVAEAMADGKRWTTGQGSQLYNAYPIYDWATEDICGSMPSSRTFRTTPSTT